jgi:hypothetical protein
MINNIGTIDRIVRIIAGIALLGFFVLSDHPTHWLGLIGVVPLLTAAAGHCPAYRLIGVSTCPLQTSR